ncbi:hypothetical protein PENTCL1PPCAC_4936, partial [Pristionchus entomophagus]
FFRLFSSGKTGTELAAKKKGENEKETPRSIIELNESDKLRLQPLPLYIESLNEYYLKYRSTDLTRARQEEEKIGVVLVEAMSKEIEATLTEKKDSLPLFD